MESININKKKRKPIRTSLLIGILVVLAAVLYFQVKLISFVVKNYEELNVEPLMYAARRYDIADCMCFINQNTKVAFGKDYSKIIKSSGESIALEINISDLEGFFNVSG